MLALTLSASASLAGTMLTAASIYRFKELSRRFFAVRLLTALAAADGAAAAMHLLGAYDYAASQSLPALCLMQSVALLYFNLASILWTSCLAFTLCRDVVPSHRRRALRAYEPLFHTICWLLPALPAAVTALSSAGSDASSWCAPARRFSSLDLLTFYAPLACAYTFILAVYAMVWRYSSERRVSRAASLYLLAFGVVWLPSLLSRAMALVGADDATAPSLALALLEAACMPAQGALNAAVYGWSLPAIRDMYRTMLLGVDAVEGVSIVRGGGSGGEWAGGANGAISFYDGGVEHSGGSDEASEYSPPARYPPSAASGVSSRSSPRES